MAAALGPLEDERALILQTRDALSHLHDLGYLQLHPLARATGSGRELRRALLEGIEEQRPGSIAPSPRDWRRYRILARRYLDGREIGAIQAELAIGRSEYHREHARGLAAVAARLRERLGGQEAPASAAPRARPRDNLPLYLTSFVGREAETAEVRRLLGTTRLLTLTGTGGCGKTRLAVQVAAGWLDEYPDGVWLVELAPVADPAAVPAAVAAAVGVRADGSQPIGDTLLTALRSRRTLLLLDNCEHLLDAAARLADGALRAGPGVRVLATSREALGIAGEVSWRVPSLAAPDPQDLAGTAEDRAAAALSYAAVRLFAERAAAAQPAFALTDANVLAAARICQRLDGIPLAIELAAARVRGLSADQLAGRLDQRFRLLTGGSRTVLPRQQTLRATVDWSYELLSEAERVLFDRLAVFSGGFPIEAAEDVGAGGALPAADVLDVLLRLVDKSLVVAEAGAAGPDRYRLLETLRQYARERLLTRDEADAVSERHAAYYLALAERAERESYGPAQAEWLDWFRREHDNLRAALRWYVDRQATQPALRLAGAMARFWNVLRYRDECAEQLPRVLALPGADEPTDARATVLDATLELLAASNRAAALGYAEALLTLARGRNDQRLIGRGLYGIAWTRFWPGDFAGVEATYEEALRLARAADDPVTVARALAQLGLQAMQRGDHGAARGRLEEAVAAYRSIGDRVDQVAPLYLLGNAAYFAGDLAAARRHCEESLAIARELLGRRASADALDNLGLILTALGEHDAARDALRESVAVRWEIGQRLHLAWGFERLAGLARAEGRWARALRLGGAAAAVRESFGLPVPPLWRPELEAWLDEARTALAAADPAAAARAQDEGRAMPLERAVAYALSDQD
jgi:predicted ATPase